jgi:hypothetical protein
LKIFQNSISNLQYKRTRRTCQQWHKTFPYPLSRDPINQFKNLSKTALRIMEYLIHKDNNHDTIHATQQKIAEYCGEKTTRETVNRIIGELIQHGFLASNYRHMTSCEYKITPFLKLIPIRQQLSSLIGALKYISMAVLTTTLLHMATIPNPEITQVKSYLNYYIYLAKRNSHILYNQDTCKRIAGGKILPIGKLFKKNETNMNNPPPKDILAFMNLTALGYARLSVFPEAALSWASSRIQKHKGIKDPFTYFHKLCKIYCQENGVDPDWSLYQSIVSKNKLDPLGPVMKGPMLVVQQPEKSVYKNSQKRDGRYSIELPKRNFIHNVLTDEEIKQRFVDKRKAWIETLPPSSEEVCRNMRPFFPGNDEEFEKVIAQNNEERKSWIASSPPIAQPPQPVVVSQQPLTFDEAPEYGENYNDDELYEEIIEGPIW